MSAIDRKQRKRVGHRWFGLGSRSKKQLSSEDARAAMQQRLVVVAVPPSPKPSEHRLEGVVVHAPPNLQRFEKATLENPVLLDPKVYEGGQTKGYVLRYYDPKTYAETGEGIQHEKSFPVEKKDDLLAFIKDDLGGDLSSRAESSHKPRWTIQKRIEKDGKEYRPNVDIQELIR